MNENTMIKIADILMNEYENTKQKERDELMNNFKINSKYYDDDKQYRISFMISNSISPSFLVWATCEQYALEELGEWITDNEDYQGLYYTFEELEEIANDDDIDVWEHIGNENLYSIDNGNYIDMNMCYIVEYEGN